MRNKNTRDNSIDALAGLMITVMVVSHCLPCGIFKDFTLFFNFFMPWFYYKSGLFYKGAGVRLTIKRGWSTLILPYIKYSVFGWVVFSGIQLWHGDYNWMHYVLTPIKEIILVSAIQGNLVLWFLPSLFAVRVIYSFAHSRGVNTILVSVISLATSICLFYLGNPLPVYIETFFSGMFFYTMGCLLREKQGDSKWCMAAIIPFALMYIDEPAVNMKDNALLQGFYPLWFVFSSLGCLVWTWIFKKVKCPYHILSFIGRNSLFILGTHWVILNVLKEIRLDWKWCGEYEYMAPLLLITSGVFVIALILKKSIYRQLVCFKLKQ